MYNSGVFYRRYMKLQSLSKSQLLAGITLIICLIIGYWNGSNYYSNLMLVYAFQISSYYLNRDNSKFDNVLLRSLWRHLPNLFFISTFLYHMTEIKSSTTGMISFALTVLIVKTIQYIIFGKILFLKFNLKFIRVQPNYDKYWYLAYINDLFFSIVSEEILRFLWLLEADNYPMYIVVLASVFNFELQHTFDRYYKVNLKDMCFRFIFTVIQVIIFFQYKSLFLMLVLHLLTNSESVIFIVRMLQVKRKGK